MGRIKTCEFVSPHHPDKLCDQIADAILDECLRQDVNSRVAIEALGGHGVVTLSGEITSKAQFDAGEIVRSVTGDKLKVISYIEKQSPEISRGVDTGGAGDQGIMTGYATAETKTLMPLEYELARDLCQKVYGQYTNDGKVQITIEDKQIKTVVVSFQKAITVELTKFVKSIISAEEYLINPAGDWQLGGFTADSGCTGRKIVIDNYGPEISVGGGAFSGKDYTKVDRSAAYMARFIAVQYIKQGAKQALVKLAYAIGKAQPVMAVAIVDGQEIIIKNYDLRPQAICERFELAKPIYLSTAQWGHFGRDFLWN